MILSEGSVSLDMEARRLAILSSHICRLGSSQPRGQTPIVLFSILSFSDCAFDSDETSGCVILKRTISKTNTFSARLCAVNHQLPSVEYFRGSSFERQPPLHPSSYLPAGNMGTNTSPLALLTNNNYADWSVKMQNNLLAQGLWIIVETSLKPPKPDDEVVEFEAWRKMNDGALHAIQSLCGMDMLSRIDEVSSAKIAWETLAEMLMELQRIFYNTIEQGHSYSSNISGSGQESQNMPTGTGVDQRVLESGNSSNNEGRSYSSNISVNGQEKLIQAEAIDSTLNERNYSSSSALSLSELFILPDPTLKFLLFFNSFDIFI